MKNIIEPVKDWIETNYIKMQYKRLARSTNLYSTSNSKKNVKKLGKIWSKKTSPIFKNDLYNNKLFYTTRDWMAGTFETTWHIKEWKNFEVDDSRERIESFRDTLLQKGSSNRFYEIFQMRDDLIMCSRRPYSPGNGLIEIPVNKEALEHLIKNNLNKFKSVYGRWNAPYGRL